MLFLEPIPLNATYETHMVFAIFNSQNKSSIQGDTIIDINEQHLRSDN